MRLAILWLGVFLTLVFVPAFAQTETPTHMPMKQGQWREMMESLSPEGQEIFKEHRKAMSAMHRDHYSSMESYRDKMKDILEAQNFDREAYLALIDEIDMQRLKHHKQRAIIMADMLAKLSPEDRKVFAEHPFFGSWDALRKGRMFEDEDN